MRKALSLYLPMWPVDLARRREARLSSPGTTARGCATPPEQRETAASALDVRPMLFVTMVANQQRVAACCERALEAGVRAGMTVAHARALLPVEGSSSRVRTDLPRDVEGRRMYKEAAGQWHGESVRILEHRPERDLAALRGLAAWMTRIAPVVACDEPDGLLMDLSGCERLYHCDEQMVRLVARAGTRLGVRARVAIGPTPGSAWAMARFGPARLSMIKPGPGGGGLREALAPLPVQALRIDDQTVAALAEVGIERIGHLLDVARCTLPSRFGGELLLRLDQALGEAMEVIEPVRPVPPPEAHMAFTGPTTRGDAVDEAARRLLEELCGQLTRLERGVRRLDVTLERIDADDVALTVSLSHPNRNVRHLWSMLVPKLERANLGFGVEGVRLVATKTGRLRHAQGECWRDEDAAGRAVAERARGELIDTLLGRLGRDRVVRLEMVQTHIPERVFRAGPVGEGTEARRHGGTKGGGTKARRHGGPEKEAAVGDRPTVLFLRAEPAQVLAIAPEGPPKWLKWRGEEYTLISAIGPERIAEEWWVGREGTQGHRDGGTEGAPVARDYFKVQTEAGRWLWMFRRVPGRWFVHGEWS